MYSEIWNSFCRFALQYDMLFDPMKSAEDADVCKFQILLEFCVNIQINAIQMLYL